MISIQEYKKKLNVFIHVHLNENSDKKKEQLSTIHRLINISKNLADHNFSDLDFFSKKFDIYLKLYSNYDENGRKKNNIKLKQDGQQLFSGLLYLRVLLAIQQNASVVDLSRYVNVCLKAFENIELPDFLKQEREKFQTVEELLFKKISNLPSSQKIKKNNSIINHKHTELSDSFTTIPIDVLFYDGPIARAYLEMLFSMKCKPKRIIHLIPELDFSSKKPLGRFLPQIIRQKYIAAIQSRKIHHWPQYLYRTNKKMCLNLFEQIHKTLKIKKETLTNFIELKNLNHYSNEVVPLSIKSLKDSRLVDYIKKQATSQYLFTGGGIVPRQFFDFKNKHFLHIHPGYLPEIRGADCLLWSTMLTGYASATCFYMNAGIDTGDIINATFLPKILLSNDVSKLDEKMMYRLLYSFVDPWVRSVVLRDTLLKTNNFKNIQAKSQAIDAGSTFHFMHKRLRKKVVENFIIKNS